MKSLLRLLIISVSSFVIGCGGSGGALTSLGKICSNDDPGICKGETFCKLASGDCALSSPRSGVCSEISQVCPEIYSPVCGCDNNTYSNECFADGAAVSVLYNGECRF
jgi:hypothetical protein